ncbi:MAG TPA: hypothetical protein VIZ66_03885 [Sphingomicrobium sp.]
MTDSRVALGMDRLPWLPDEPVRPATPSRRADGATAVLGWGVAALLLVGGTSYWLGTRSAGDSEVAITPRTTVTLPDARPAPPEEIRPIPAAPPTRVPPAEVRRPTVPKVSDEPGFRLPRTIPKDLPERVKRTLATDERNRVSDVQQEPRPKSAPQPAAPPVVNTQRVRLWPARESAGAAGRVVQIGAFGSRLQAKRGWVHMARAYPGVKRLPAVVVETRNSRGRRFYRFQIGTTSQAHSEVLCQRMERIRFSCAVAGLPGARKAIER